MTNLEHKWPELFEGLDRSRRQSVIRAFDRNRQGGWEPDRGAVKDLTDLARGDIDEDEYIRRCREVEAKIAS
ncbi:MAG: hypothetical protein Q4D79_10535 [Propionibacteriaceae bacterium]|nr:hypothetical protein [Propionibacteriaceae bacterium]